MLFCAVSMTASPPATGEVLVGGARLLGQRVAEPVGHAVQPLADGLVEFGPGGAEDIGHRGKTALQFALATDDLGHCASRPQRPARLRLHRLRRRTPRRTATSDRIEQE